MEVKKKLWLSLSLWKYSVENKIMRVSTSKSKAMFISQKMVDCPLRVDPFFNGGD